MIFVWIVLGIVVFVVGLFILLWLNAIRASIVRNRQLDEMIQEAVQAVEENDPSVQDIVAGVAAVPATRNHLYAKLKEMGKTELFPMEQRSAEKVAESDMVCWLMHPNELKAAPSEIELVRDYPVEEDGKKGRMFLFRFRIDSPHWASDRGWMAGVAGPYWDGEDLPDFVSGTFSELTPFESMTEEEHIAYLHKSRGSGLVVPS